MYLESKANRSCSWSSEKRSPESSWGG